MRALIITAALLVATVATAQSYDNPTPIMSGIQESPLNEWYTLDGGTTKYYKGEKEHVDETAWVILYDMEGDWRADDSVAVRENDRYTTMKIGGGMKDVYIWDLHDGNSLFLIMSDDDDTAMIFVKPTEQ